MLFISRGNGSSEDEGKPCLQTKVLNTCSNNPVEVQNQHGVRAQQTAVSDAHRGSTLKGAGALELTLGAGGCSRPPHLSVC